MGIEKFGKIFHRKFFRPAEGAKLPKRVNSLFIDCNGIFHKAKSKVYPILVKDGEKVADEQEVKKKFTLKGLKDTYIQTIIDNLEDLFDQFKPTDNFIIAPDGVANAAKLNQQKTRRFGPKEEVFYGFDGNSLTPGTEIMISIDKAIKSWLDKKAKKGQLPPNTIYSSHMDVAEGEHKIFHYIRQKMIILPDSYKGVGEEEDDILDSDDDFDWEESDDEESSSLSDKSEEEKEPERKPAHVVFGDDGDLFILSLLSPLDNIYVYRFDKPFDMEKFKDGVWKSISFDGCDEKRLYQDFALLVMFVGNDFVPKFPNLPGTANTLFDIMFRVYRSMREHLTDDDNKIIWDRFVIFLRKLDSWKVNRTDDTYHYARDNLQFPVKEIDKHTVIKDSSGKLIDWMEGDFDQSKHTREFRKRDFERDWYQKQFKPMNIKLYKEAKKEIPELNSKGSSKGRMDSSDLEFYSMKDVFKMCVSYLKTLQWNQWYYTKGYRHVSSQHFYPYRITPLVHNLSFYLTSMIKRDQLEILDRGILHNPDDFEITPVHQLMSVLPPTSVALIPKEFRDLYPNTRSINPSEYLILSPENTDEIHHHNPLIPPINLKLIDMLIRESEVPIPKKYQTEQYVRYDENEKL